MYVGMYVCMFTCHMCLRKQTCTTIVFVCVKTCALNFARIQVNIFDTCTHIMMLGFRV